MCLFSPQRILYTPHRGPVVVVSYGVLNKKQLYVQQACFICNVMINMVFFQAPFHALKKLILVAIYFSINLTPTNNTCAVGGPALYAAVLGSARTDIGRGVGGLAVGRRAGGRPCRSTDGRDSDRAERRSGVRMHKRSAGGRSGRDKRVEQRVGQRVDGQQPVQCDPAMMRSCFYSSARTSVRPFDHTFLSISSSVCSHLSVRLSVCLSVCFSVVSLSSVKLKLPRARVPERAARSNQQNDWHGLVDGVYAKSENTGGRPGVATYSVSTAAPIRAAF